ncbi:TetR family transcriptional regulator [Bradyrhizobium sp. CSA207]|uniref:TetR/AcrR family transcriptional regulator n=1 Tax=Bradyrhizobium sp. CSA207 TaxID=2698826 RepID=UPI0023B0BF90|nr:TetR/AcrR family transcriptional regulator [Bradyrhizobium sp. CSA207]MDE5444348.1 TetR family transcriptional regulator [Bradyrhizobium sp. CSA207]
MPSAVSTKAQKPKTSKEMAPKADRATKGMQARERIISVAEAIFNKQGFDGTSMRDIAAAAEMQPASMYYHFESKEELLWAVWEKGGIELRNRVNAAIEAETGPWQRMETACVAHVTGLLDWRRANQVLFVMPPWHYPESIKARVIALRHGYEQIFVSLIDDLPLRTGIDRRYLRLTLIGALSWSLFWFKKERDTPAAIAKQILSMLREGIEGTK